MDGSPSFEERVAALSPEQKRALLRELPPTPAKLVAYWSPTGSGSPNGDDLRRFLAARLPEYMIPAQFVRLDELPRTPGGKLDRRALPPPEAPAGSAPERTAPRNATEAALTRIWQETLGIDGVGVDDDFFEVGGDSLLSIRILSRARRQGIEVNPETFFAKPTIAALAAAAGRGPAQEGTDEPLGEAPLTPVQHWFFENVPAAPEHWNQSFLLTAPPELDEPTLRLIVAALLRNHDALRLRLGRSDTGLRQIFPPPGGEPPVRLVRLAGREERERPETVRTIAEEMQAGFDLFAGGLIRFVLFDAGPAERKKLLIVAHHLLVDGVSWSVLFEDFESLYRRARAGEPLALPSKTASYRRWAQALVERAGDFVPEAEHWLELIAAEADVPVDRPFRPDLNLAGETAVATVALEADETGRLLDELPRGLDAQTRDILLAALVRAWSAWSGRRRLLLDVEGHGRDAIGGLDVSRTIGWFTVVYPVLLEVDSAGEAETIRAVRLRLESIPRGGAGEGVLRYLAPEPELARRLSGRGRPQALFNYMGRVDHLLPDDALLRLAEGPHGPDRSPCGRRPYLLELNGRVERGCLRFDLAYHPEFHDRATIERLADLFASELRALAEPSQPLSFAGLDRESVEQIASLLAEIDSAD